MQFGAAVRLKGTWKSPDAPSKGGLASDQQTDGSITSSDCQETEAAMPPELQVDEIEVLGHSTASVNLPSSYKN